MKINLQKIPHNPGCYLFKSKDGKVIYVGKAKSLNHRVRSYFQKKDFDEKTKALVSNIDDAEFFITDTEVEAFILENNLIKKFKPRYNIDLKDSKRYAYIEITGEEYPRLLIARTRSSETKGKLYGPFVSGANRDYVLEALRRIFKIRTCKKLPKKECIRFSIGLCSAPCIKNISREDYLESVRSAELVLKGNTKGLITILFNRMKESSARQEFERALEIKNQIEAVKELQEKQKVEKNRDFDEDVLNYIVHNGKIYITIFNSKKGILENKQDFEFDYTPSFLEDFIVQYYSDNRIPKEIILPESIDPNLEVYLKTLKGSSVSLSVPVKGEKKELLELVKKNIEIILFGDSDKVRDLGSKLNLQKLPEVIECFDISHLSGTYTVASMVQFRNGKSDKSNYRRFKIQTVSGIDDYAAIKEVVRRRYSRIKEEALPFPDLIIIDGGKGQLSSALEELDKLEIKIPIISIAKREEEIFEPGKDVSILLDKKSKALKFVQEIRDEAHRFAIKYNRLLKKKEIRQA